MNYIDQMHNWHSPAVTTGLSRRCSPNYRSMCPWHHFLRTHNTNMKMSEYELYLSCEHIIRIITADAVHAVVDAGQKIRRVRHRVVVGRQAGATVARLLSTVLGDAGQIRIHLMGHRLLLLLILMARHQVLLDDANSTLVR